MPDLPVIAVGSLLEFALGKYQLSVTYLCGNDMPTDPSKELSANRGAR